MTTNRAQRTRRLRRLTVRGSIAAFLAAWAIVFGQLVSGHDPALGQQQKSQQQKSQKQSKAASTTPAPATAAPPVTTSQS
jgi:heme A synthase